MVKSRSLKNVVRSLLPFAAMTEKTIYYPLDSRLPCGEAYFKLNGKLYIIQVSVKADNKECSNGALAMFLQMIDFPSDQLNSVHMIYVRASRKVQLVTGQGQSILSVSYVHPFSTYGFNTSGTLAMAMRD